MITNKGVAIKYGNVAPEAKENFDPTASESQFDTLSQLQRYNLYFPNYGNPCELYSVVLDGAASAVPSITENTNIGLWSEEISNEYGYFEDPIVLTLTSQGQYSSPGFTFTFDEYKNVYATSLKIQWYRVSDGAEDELWSQSFYPNNAVYFCEQPVENYNKVVITFYSLNMPKNRLKLRVIDYGYGTFLFGDQLRNVKLIQEIDPISTQISINTADFSIDSKSGTPFSFQAKQPLSVYFNDKLLATTFVKSSKRTSKFLWSIQSEDYIGILDGVPYYGGIYNEEKAVDILNDIFSVAKVPYSIDPNFDDKTVTGYIPYTTCRDALMQVAFAIQAAVDTSNSDVVKVFSLDDEVKQEVTLDRIMQGQNFDEEETVTGVEVAVHTYRPVTDTLDAYDANESGTGKNIFVKFSEPLHNLTITNGSFAIDENGNELKHANYAVINAENGCVLTGQKYEHTTTSRRWNNPISLASDPEKVLYVDGATLVSQYNIDKIFEKCYTWLAKTNTTNLKIVEGKHIQYGEIVKYGQNKYGAIKYGQKNPDIVTYDKEVNVGDKISAQTEYLGSIVGTITKQTFNLNGGIIIKEAVLK